MRIISLVFIAVSAFVVAAPLKLAEGGRALSRIVCTPQAREAAEELKWALDEITGADFKISEDGDGPAIFVGKTDYAKSRVILDGMASEEWLVKTDGDNMIVCGGGNNGTLYGVYELLERCFGCRFLAEDTNVIPKRSTLVLDAVELKGHPSFACRDMVDDFYKSYWKGKAYFGDFLKAKKRMRATLNYGYWNFYSPGKMTSRQYPEMHNFYSFLEPKKYFDEHPEYFSMGTDGKRFHGNLGPTMQGGNFCMSNPAVSEIVYDKLVEYIKADRQKLPKDKWPVVYNISQMDNCHFFCLCDDCVALSKKYGGDAGLLLHFLNPIAERIRKEYPEITIMTFAYSGGKDAPVGIKPAENIIIQWCNLYGFNDCYRPITHTVNSGQKAQFDRWAATGANLALWVYWNMGGRYFEPPRVETLVDAIAPEFRYYKEHGVKQMFIESERDFRNPQPFYALHRYLGHRLMYDVNADTEVLVSEFLDGYYGPAAKHVGNYLEMLRKKVASVDFQMTAVARDRPYCTEAFMRDVWTCIMDAYNATEEGSMYRRHVETEMLTPIHVILRNQRWAFGDRDFMLSFYKEYRQRLIDAEKNEKNRQKMIDELDVHLKDFIAIDLPVPTGFESRKTIMIGWPKMSWAHNSNKDTIVDDPDSITGKALVTPPSPPERYDITKEPVKGFLPINFGCYDYTNKRSLGWYFKQEVPQDEKYHWYRIGKYNIGPGSFVWGFYWSTRCDISWCHQGDDGMPGLNEWEVWVSAKFTGPSFVKGSTKKNEIFWDQVMLVK